VNLENMLTEVNQYKRTHIVGLTYLKYLELIETESRLEVIRGWVGRSDSYY
jgi:hypothetical protein